MKRTKRLLSVILCLLFVCSATIVAFASDYANENNGKGKSASNEAVEANTDFEKNRTNASDLPKDKDRIAYPVSDVTANWPEYIPYQSTSYTSFDGDEGEKYEVYMPTDLGKSLIMEAKAYDLESLHNDQLGAVFQLDLMLDEASLLAQIVAGNVGVVSAGGIGVGLTGGVTQTIIGTLGVGGLLSNACYYAGDYYTGLSNNGFYSMDSITIGINNSIGHSISKSTSVNYSAKSGGSNELGGSIGLEMKFKSEFSSTISTNYGITAGQSGSTGNSLSMTFAKRTDAELRDAAWRIVEYKAIVPLKICLFKNIVDENDIIVDNKPDPVETYYVKEYLLSGYCREWANGYIEHWNTGKLVFRADFYKGFLTPYEASIKNKENIVEKDFIDKYTIEDGVVGGN